MTARTRELTLKRVILEGVLAASMLLVGLALTGNLDGVGAYVFVAAFGGVYIGGRYLFGRRRPAAESTRA